MRVRQLRDPGRSRKGTQKLRSDRFHLRGGAGMNPPRFQAAIQAAARDLAPVPGVRSVVLFGSAARGSAAKRSDIDLFIDCDRDAEDAACSVLLALDGEFDVGFRRLFYRPGAREAFDEKIDAFDELLRRYGAKRHIIPIWSQRP